MSFFEEYTQSHPDHPPDEEPSARESYVLHSLLRDNKEKVIGELRRRLEKFLPSGYYQMILNDPKGRRRTEDYYDAFLMALEGDLSFFIRDQERIGYIRAIEGYPLEGVIEFTLTFKSVIRDFVSQYNQQLPTGMQRISVDEVFYLHRILDHSYYALSRSFLSTRDEIIDKRRNQLSYLHNFAGAVISVLNEDMLWEPLLKGVDNLFGLKAQLVVEPGNAEALLGLKETPPNIGSPLVGPLADESIALARTGHLAVAAGPDEKPRPFGEQAEQKDFLCICHSLPHRSGQSQVFLLLHNQGRPFVFEPFDQNLLSQLIYFTGAVLANCSMVSELAEKREYLSNLTAVLFDVQEKERKRIAADIHDVITQALSGIGFKVVLCQELLEKQPQRLEEELSRLVDNVNQALRHSRHIVSNLRPNILDDLGVVAALKKIVHDFQENTGVEIEFSSPPSLDLAPGADISIFRILQESLHNIRKHAHARRVRVRLKVCRGHQLEMIIEDDGQGFDPTRRALGLGLMLMQERAENLGGALSLQSSPGQGAAIKVVLPLDGKKRNGPN